MTFAGEHEEEEEEAAEQRHADVDVCSGFEGDWPDESADAEDKADVEDVAAYNVADCNFGVLLVSCHDRRRELGERCTEGDDRESYECLTHAQVSRDEDRAVNDPLRTQDEGCEPNDYCED